jgi:hypothetical protein
MFLVSELHRGLKGKDVILFCRRMDGACMRNLDPPLPRSGRGAMVGTDIRSMRSLHP